MDELRSEWLAGADLPPHLCRQVGCRGARCRQLLLLVLGSSPSPGSSPPFCKRMPSDMRKASACTATLIIRWGTPAKILSVISNFEVCRDTYSLGIASM